MREFINRRIKVFGKSIPLSLIAGLVLVVGVVSAIFLFQHNISMTLQAGAGTNGDFGTVSCYEDVGPGTKIICETDYDNKITTVEYTELNDDTVLRIKTTYNPFDIDQVFSVVHPDPLPDGVSAIYSPQETGLPVSPGIAVQYDIILEFETLTASQVIEPFEIAWLWVPAP